MSEINLSSAVRSSLSSLQATADLLTTTQERLSTGNRVNSALDDATSFFTASGLNARASDLSTLLDAQQQAIRTVEAADEGISAITDLVDSARAQANAALQSDDASVRAEAAAAFDDILDQIETLAGDASFNGINLLDSENSTDLTVVFNEDNSASLTVEGVNFTDAAAGLGLNRVSSVNNQTNAGAATASATQTAASDFNTTDTFTFNVGNSNGTTTSFNVNFTDTDAAPAVAASAVLDASSFNTTDTFNVVGVDGTQAITFVDNDTVNGVATADDGTGAGQIDLTNLATGDTIQLDDGNGGGFTFTVGATPPADFEALALQINQQAVVDGNTTLTATGDNAGGTISFASSVGDATFTFTDASDVAAATTTISSGAIGNSASGDVDDGATGAGQLDFSTLADGDTISFNLSDGSTFDFTVDAALVSAIATEVGVGGPGDLGDAAVAAAIAADPNLPANITVTNDTGNNGLDIAVGATGATIDSITFTDASAVAAASVQGSSTDGGTGDVAFVANEGESDGLSAADIAAQINAQQGGTGVLATVNPEDSSQVILTSTPNSGATAPGDFSVVQDPSGTPSTVVDTSTGGANIQSFTAEVANGLDTAEITAQINAAASAAGIDTANGALTVGTSVSAGVPPVTNITFSSDTGDVSISSNGSTPLAISSTAGGANDSAFVQGNGGGSDFADADAINQTLQAIDDALSTLRSSAATLGSDLSTIQIRQDFTSNLINVLEQGAGDLTLADLNEEGANLLTLQTRQQLASTSLSFATQADQSVLSLF